MNELEWLAARRPDVDPDDREHVRATLLAYMDERPARVAARHRGRTRPILAVAAVLAVAIVVASGALPSGDGTRPSLTTEPRAEAAIVTLAHKLQQAPAPPGDATLVHRSHHFPTGHDFTGVDLYFDDGRYFYGMTDAGLRANQNDVGEGSTKRELAAALLAEHDGGQAGREPMRDATFANGRPPTPQEVAAQAKEAKQIRAEKLNGDPDPTPVSQLSIDNNRIWIGAMDALIAGAGRADVRAGVMNVLSTIAAVHSERDGDTISITNTDFPHHYQETLIVGADSGVIQQMVGGTAGAAPDVTVDYKVERVTAADYLSGH